MIVKAVSELACVIGSEVIVGGIVKGALDAQSNKALKACGKIASICVAGVVGTAAANYADEMIDNTVQAVEKITDRTKDGGGNAGAKERTQ